MAPADVGPQPELIDNRGRVQRTGGWGWFYGARHDWFGVDAAGGPLDAPESIPTGGMACEGYGNYRVLLSGVSR